MLWKAESGYLDPVIIHLSGRFLMCMGKCPCATSGEITRVLAASGWDKPAGPHSKVCLSEEETLLRSGLKLEHLVYCVRREISPAKFSVYFDLLFKTIEMPQLQPEASPASLSHSAAQLLSSGFDLQHTVCLASLAPVKMHRLSTPKLFFFFSFFPFFFSPFSLSLSSTLDAS